METKRIRVIAAVLLMILSFLSAESFLFAPYVNLEHWSKTASPCTIPITQPVYGKRKSITAHDAKTSNTVVDDDTSIADVNKEKFDLSTALFCGGLAFDSYVEPATNSSRWEKGPQGLKVAFVSPAYTRQLYQGIVEVIVKRVTGLPDDENGMERMVSGKGVDAAVLAAAVEGSWTEDIRVLEQEIYHEGVLDLSGAAHVVRTSTAWANIDEKQSLATKKRRGRAAPYHIPSSWGKGGQAVWPEENPLYIYVQDPSTVRLVFTVMDENRIGEGVPIGSTYRMLSKLIPEASLSQEELIESLKSDMIDAYKRGEIDLFEDNKRLNMGPKPWEGDLKLSSKPRKRDKNSQVLAGAAAGAYFAGPIGAAAGALLASYYEGEIQGTIKLRLRYLPIPKTADTKRSVYKVMGGMPGVNWGDMFARFQNKLTDEITRSLRNVDDLEHCFFVNHDKTGACCAVYRSLKQKMIVVSFRGTCTPIDLVTDASLVQEAWVEGENVADQDIPKVHAGFRGSLASISRRLKELILAAVAPGDVFSDYHMLITGHSLGGALATLFTADIGEYGVDAGRGLPQMKESEPWWKSIANTFMGQEAKEERRDPPRPKTLKLYNFGSPRVGNHAFTERFESLLTNGKINQAYRIVNGEDVVARMPRTVNALVLGQIRYDHCGKTVLISQPMEAEGVNENNTEDPSKRDKASMFLKHDPVDEGEAMSGKVKNPAPLLWVEGESDANQCPVRDGGAFSNPVAEGSLLSDLVAAAKDTLAQDQGGDLSEKLSAAFGQVAARLRSATASDVGSVFGIGKEFTERELKMLQAMLDFKALAHHLEDSYYAGMGRACGFLARIGGELEELEEEYLEL
ncbi:hypothetical protein ACA910_012997 [Epithemia clementina (nom. ined.)]